MSGAPILEARGLARHFVTRRMFGAPSVVRAVDGVDLAIAPGETFAIVGESGCGKTTLARLLVRLIEPSAGSVRFRGEDIAALSPSALRALRRDFQFVFQDPLAAFNPRMRVGRIVGEPMEVHGALSRAERRERMADLLMRVGLAPEYADRYPHELSGGQRQRIGIARALASGPSVVIADEPLSALDLSTQAQVTDLLQNLRDAFGLTLILIAHDLAVVRRMADRVAVMYVGQVVEEAPAEALFAAPLHPYTQALLRAMPEPRRAMSPARRVFGGEPPNPAAPPEGCRFHPRCPHATRSCARDAPPLERAEQARAVACHHWREIAASCAGYRPAALPPLRPEVARRLALFRAMAEARQSPSKEKTHALR